MIIICSYCRQKLGEKRGLGISHSVCEPCLEHFTKQWEGLNLAEYLDGFDAPVLAVDGDARVIAMNDAMASRLGKPKDQLVGLLGGEVMECSHARLPEGCGKTIHCKACTIRLTINQTIATGQPQERVPAYVMQGKVKLSLCISTVLDPPPVVRITIE
jgi:hypothetical protein